VVQRQPTHQLVRGGDADRAAIAADVLEHRAMREHHRLLDARRPGGVLEQAGIRIDIIG
jgi:hypothetical protein